MWLGWFVIFQNNCKSIFTEIFSSCFCLFSYERLLTLWSWKCAGDSPGFLGDSFSALVCFEAALGVDWTWGFLKVLSLEELLGYGPIHWIFQILWLLVFVVVVAVSFGLLLMSLKQCESFQEWKMGSSFIKKIFTYWLFLLFHPLLPYSSPHAPDLHIHFSLNLSLWVPPEKSPWGLIKQAGIKKQ